ncbi:hypothetical protein [Clostridium sp. C2-6-12]|uniref:hypothetical protein n=1 Tax=Clostridium sp. C2-6-12 TaxID=2698832 RepID=UPI00136A85CE|nr:hypothetical protein [Clostridium sp. C2-6-12]
MKKSEIFMLSITAFSIGIVLGFFISPIKKGINVIGGDNISNYYTKNDLATDNHNNIQK